MERRYDYPDILKRLNNIEEIIIGNGEPGLKERVRSIERYIVELKEFHQQIRKVIIGATGTIVSSIIIAIIIYVLIPR